MIKRLTCLVSGHPPDAYGPESDYHGMNVRKIDCSHCGADSFVTSWD